MYEIVSNECYSCLKNNIIKSRVASPYKDKSYIGCIGHHHKINDFKLNDKGHVELSYRHRVNEDIFKIVVKFVDVSFNIEIEKKNRYFLEYKNDRDNKNLSYGIIRKNIQLFGITVGDLLKHFSYNNQDEKNLTIIENSQDNPSNCTKNTENDRALNLLKKIRSIDIPIIDIRDVLGLYANRSKTIYLWECVRVNGFLSKGDNDFTGFCKKMLYFPTSVIYDLVQKKKDEYVLSNEKCYKLFNQLSDKAIVIKLLRYFLYNENPELQVQEKTHHFDTPMPIPEILKYFHAKTNDNKYIDLYHKIIKKLNGNQQKEIVIKYKPMVFKSINNIPLEYPFFALRNISLESWTHSVGYGDDDLSCIVAHYDNYMMAMKNSKCKYKLSVNKKIIPVGKRFFNSRCYDSKDNRQNKMSEIQSEIVDGIDECNKD